MMVNLARAGKSAAIRLHAVGSLAKLGAAPQLAPLNFVCPFMAVFVVPVPHSA